MPPPMNGTRDKQTQFHTRTDTFVPDLIDIVIMNIMTTPPLPLGHLPRWANGCPAAFPSARRYAAISIREVDTVSSLLPEGRYGGH